MGARTEHAVELCLVANGSGLSAADTAWLLDRARAALDLAVDGSGRGGGELRVRVVGDPEMAAAHVRYSGVEGTTDVLTFDLSEPGAPLDVDVLICIDEAARQAAGRGHSVREELLLYILHAALHCLGEDDTTDEAHARMHAREDQILAAIGVGAIYRRDERAGREERA